MMADNRKSYLDLKVGYRCNNNCLHCVIVDYEAALIADGKAVDCSTDECLEIIADASRRGVGTVTLTGGEPTIRPDFFRLLKACRAAGLEVAVQTNGRSFHAQGFCEQLKDCGTPRFVVALHGASADVHDAISQRPGSFSQTCRGIRNLCAAGYDVVGKLVISRLNAGCLVRSMDLMASLDIRRAVFAFPHGHGNARVHYRLIVPRYGEIRAEIDRLTQSAATSGFHLSLEAFPLCVLNDPQYVAEFQYLAPGDRRCIPSHAGEFDWDALRPLDKCKFAQCAACACSPCCEGPWKEYPETYGGAEFQPRTTETLMDLLTLGLAEGRTGDRRTP